MSGLLGRGEERVLLAAERLAAGAEHAFIDHVGQGDRIQIKVNLVAQFLPQVVGQTTTLVPCAPGRRSRRTPGRLDRLVNGDNDVGDAGFGGRVGQQVAAAGATDALD